MNIVPSLASIIALEKLALALMKVFPPNPDGLESIEVGTLE